MKLYTAYSPSHWPLFRDWLSPSLPAEDGWELRAYEIPQECPTARYMEEGWTDSTRRKAAVIAQACRDHRGSAFVWADSDVVFFHPAARLLQTELAGKDIMFMDNDLKGDPCTGMMIIRASEVTERFWRRVAEEIHPGCSDQRTAHRFLPMISYGILPKNLFTPGIYLNNHKGRPRERFHPRAIVAFHANFARGIEEKIRLLNRIRALRETAE